ncbi:MAG: hypothetical protein PHC61_15715, partial [Chitinivibrionales bacterium]|nr:hypothetical protein [Chitinivibrionales bacterium]
GRWGEALLGITAFIARSASLDKNVPLDSACFSALPALPPIAVAQNMPPHKGLFLIGLALLVLFLIGTPLGRSMLPWILLLLLSGNRRGGGGFGGGFGGGGFGGFSGGSSGGGGASGGF